MAFATINKPNTYFNTLLWTGTGATNSLTGVNFKPDFVWIKQRSSTTWHNLYDINRGVTKALASNDTGAEDTRATGLTSFNTDGFTVGSDNNANGSSNTYAAWNWLGSNTTTNNTAGTISSTVCANTTSGFSVVKYTGTGSLATVGHGLGVAPAMIIIKRYDGGSGGQWNIYHQALGNTKVIYLNSTATPDTTATRWNNTSPTSSVFTINTSGDVNNSTNNHIAYCFAEVKGYSAFGSYAGTGSTNGPFIYTGFKPAFIMIKTTSAAEAWNMGDNKRNITYPAGANVNNAELYANSSSAETDRSTRGGGTTQFDMLSNGFKCRGVNPDINYSGYNYIYMAFAENPFVGTNNVPTTAR